MGRGVIELSFGVFKLVSIKISRARALLQAQNLFQTRFVTKFASSRAYSRAFQAQFNKGSIKILNEIASSNWAKALKRMHLTLYLFNKIILSMQLNKKLLEVLVYFANST